MAVNTTITAEQSTREAIRSGIASSLFEDILNPDKSYFIVLGRNFPWNTTTGVALSSGGETIPYPTDDVDTYNESMRNGFFAKRVGANDVRLMLPYVKWIQGTRYSKYASNLNVFDEAYLFFVVTSDGSVYKCLENGRNSQGVGLPSIYEPNVKDTANSFKTPDGYTWKYLFTIPDFERRLVTEFSNETNYIPVSRPRGNYSFGERILQYEVQENAVAGTIDSVIFSSSAALSGGTGSQYSVSSAKNLGYQIVSGVSGATTITIGSPSLVSPATNAYKDFTITITNGLGAGISRQITAYSYGPSGGVVSFGQPLERSIPAGSNYQIAPTIKIFGDGTGAAGYLKLTEYPKPFGIEKFVLTNTGRNYTVAFTDTPLPFGTLSDFSTHCNVAPPGGHGYNAVRELNPSYVQVCVDINGGETASTLHLADGEFRQISIIKNPLLWNSNRIAGSENNRFNEVFLRTGSSTADIQHIVAGNYIFGETSLSVGQIESVRNTGRDWMLLVKNLNGSLIPSGLGASGENVSVYTRPVIGSEFKRVAKDAAFVLSSAPYLAANATNQVYKLTATVGITGASFSNSISSYKGGYAKIAGVSAHVFNGRIFSIRATGLVTGATAATHLVELAGIVGIDNLIAPGITGSQLTLDRIVSVTGGYTLDANDGFGQIVFVEPPAFEPLSGEIVYIENTEPKTRDRVQTERISILIKI